jgi:hypothetical protein
VKPNERTTAAGHRVGNQILLSISDEEYALIIAHLEFVNMPQHLSLYEPGQMLEFVHFPNTGMVSLVIATEDGRTVEVGRLAGKGLQGYRRRAAIQGRQSPHQKHSGDEIDQFLSTFVHRREKISSSLSIRLTIFRGVRNSSAFQRPRKSLGFQWY